MNDDRPDPDTLLAQVQREENLGKHGRLFLFLGMCPGVGKTYAMLQAARQRQQEGTDVLVGVVETHGRAETEMLLDGLKILPRMLVEHGGHRLTEFDLDAALAARPELLLVDELAHTNAPGGRHRKRYQDVVELLDAGIDVYTTVNIQHIESQVDIVRQITGVSVLETVPDSMLDRAHEIQLIDLSVEKLMQRLFEGKIYLGERAQAAVDGFFREGNLTALREMALRFTAEHVDRDLEDIRRARRISSPWKTNARLLVGIGPTPYSESLIRWTRRAAGRLGSPWLAVWVERTQPLGVQEQELLARSLGLVRKLGGEVVHATGHDIAVSLLEVARERNVSQIIVGKPGKRVWWKTSLADKIISDSGDIDVCVVRPMMGRLPKRGGEPKSVTTHRLSEYAKVLLATTILTAVCWVFQPVTGYTMPAMVFLLGLLLAALRFARGPVLMMATLCALAWDYFFLPPKFTFQVKRVDDLAVLMMFFAVALCMGHLTARLRRREVAERRRQMETDALLRVTQSAALTADADKGLGEALRIIDSILGAETALVVRNGDHQLFGKTHRSSSYAPTPQEFGVASWAYANRQVAGRYTDTLPQSESTWFPLQTATSIMGVLGVKFAEERTTLDFVRRQAVEAFALQLALVLEKEHFIQAVTQAELVEKSERLRRTLLDSVSHELKTPLAIIRAAVEGMEDRGKDPYVSEIDTASQRLQRLVDGLLQMTRLESQVIEPHLEWCDVSELLDEVIATLGEARKYRDFPISLPADFPFVRTDHALLAQALANVLHNAVVYTPPDSEVEISVSRDAKTLFLTIRDHGPGLPEGEEARVFGKFYRTPGSPAGGTGLGLSIARGLLRALGGEITAKNHEGGGAVFEISLVTEFMDSGNRGIPDLVFEPGSRAL